MTIVSALKKLHKKMTGKDATGLNIANVIDSLQENYTGEGGGGSLPTPGADGNVLTADSGKWVSSAPPQSDNDYIVRADLDSTNLIISNIVPATYLDIQSARADGKSVRLIAYDSSKGVTWEANLNLEVTDADMAIFSGAVALPDGHYMVLAIITRNEQGETISGGLTAYPLAPLALTGTASGSDFTITSATAAEIAAAWNANRDVIIPMTGFNVKLELKMCDYIDANNYKFEFTTYGISASTGKLTVYLLEYEDSLNTTLVYREYEPVANP